MIHQEYDSSQDTKDGADGSYILIEFWWWNTKMGNK